MCVERRHAAEHADLVPLGRSRRGHVQPSNAPKVKVLASGAPAAVTIHGGEWPFAVLLLRGTVEVDQVAGIAPEYRACATRYFGAEQGEAWCASLPADLAMTRFRLEPSWVGLLDFEEMRRLPSAIAG